MDLLLVAGTTLVAMAVVELPGLRETPLRGVFGLALVLFLPGYAILGALFPAGASRFRAGAVSNEERLDSLERVALAMPVSISITVVTAISLALSPLGIQVGPLLLVLGGVVLAGVVVGAYRRHAATAGEGRQPDRAAGEPAPGDREFDWWVQFALVASIVLAAGAVAYPIGVPTQGESFTGLALQTEGPNGTLVSAGYPTNMTTGESRSLVVAVANSEQQAVEYTIVVLLQNVSTSGDRIHAETRVGTYSKRVEHGATWHVPHTIAPTMTGDRLRLRYLLYKGSPPTDPSIENADKELHLWMRVTERRSNMD